ncbi:MAG: hypothetical protein WCT46_02310 [Candidatus Gracilibacteria bacterium]|jgi:hypothetical protein
MSTTAENQTECPRDANDNPDKNALASFISFFDDWKSEPTLTQDVPTGMIFYQDQYTDTASRAFVQTFHSFMDRHIGNDPAHFSKQVETTNTAVAFNYFLTYKGVKYKIADEYKTGSIFAYGVHMTEIPKRYEEACSARNAELRARDAAEGRPAEIEEAEVTLRNLLNYPD